VLGKEHPDTGDSSYDNIGAMMQAMDDNVGALEMHNRALEIREKVHGKDHSGTGVSYNNIGNVMQAMGDNIGALKMHYKSLTICEKALGKDHSGTLSSREYNAGHG
jgi:hypothetical protein